MNTTLQKPKQRKRITRQTAKNKNFKQIKLSKDKEKELQKRANQPRYQHHKDCQEITPTKSLFRGAIGSSVYYMFRGYSGGAL